MAMSEIDPSVAGSRAGVIGRISRRVSRPLSDDAVTIGTSSIAGVVAIVLLSAPIHSYWREGDWGIARMLTPRPGGRTSGADDFLTVFPGDTQPPTISAEGVAWKDDDEVIGVSVAGESRAYLLSSLANPSRHVVNDLVGATPVSITYCNIDRCVRAFTSASKGSPLALSVGGLYQARSLLLLVDGARFHQRTRKPYLSTASGRPFPYEELPVTVTTWKKWRRQHPATRASNPTRDTMEPPPGKGLGSIGSSGLGEVDFVDAREAVPRAAAERAALASSTSV